MKMLTKVLTLAVVLVSTSASAWWNDNDDYWDRGPWYGGYPGYGGWGGYPGYGGWGGYPGYGGWGAAQPQVIYTQPQGSGTSQEYRIR